MACGCNKKIKDSTLLKKTQDDKNKLKNKTLVAKRSIIAVKKKIIKNK